MSEEWQYEDLWDWEEMKAYRDWRAVFDRQITDEELEKELEEELEEELKMVTIELENRTEELDIDRDMRLTDDTLDEDLCELAGRIAFYAELYGDTKADAMRCEQEVKYQASRAAQNIREKAAKDGVRTTEPGIKEQVRLSDAYNGAKRALFRATAQATMVEGFYRALRDKASLGIALCYKQKEEIRVTNSPIN